MRLPTFGSAAGGEDNGPVYRAVILPALWGRAVTQQGPLSTSRAARKLGRTSLRAGAGSAQISLPSLQPALSPTLSRHFALPAGERSLPEDNLSAAPGWHQPQPSRPPRRHRRGHGRALFPARPAAAVQGMASATVSPVAGHRRALLHSPQGLRHHAVRSEEPQNLRRGAGPVGGRSGGLFSASGRQARGADGVHGSVLQLPGAGAETFSHGSHCGRSLPRDPDHQPPLLSLLERSRRDRQQEPRPGLADAPPPAQPESRPATPSGGLPRGAPGSGTDLSVQAAAMLSAAEKTSHPTSVRPISAALPARRSPVAPGRPGATDAARRNS